MSQSIFFIENLIPNVIFAEMVQMGGKAAQIAGKAPITAQESLRIGVFSA